jgi:signal transduction histidine kinase
VSGFGLLGMRERVEGLGGDFAIETNLNTGTSMNGATIYAWIPLREFV